MLTGKWHQEATAKGSSKFPCCAASICKFATASSLAIIGQSGSGKSTLLHLLGTLDRARRGRGSFRRASASTILPAAGRDALRNTQFGMIFQFYHLLPELTTLENVLAPLMIADGVL